MSEREDTEQAAVFDLIDRRALGETLATDEVRELERHAALASEDDEIWTAVADLARDPAPLAAGDDPALPRILAAHRRRRSTARTFAAGAAMAAAASVIAVLAARGPEPVEALEPTAKVEVPAAPIAAHEPVTAPWVRSGTVRDEHGLEIGSGERLAHEAWTTVTSEGDACIQAAPFAEMCLVPGTEARFAAPDEGAYAVRLRRGTVRRAKVDHAGPGQRLEIRAPQAAAIVSQPAEFSLEIGEQPGQVIVAVLVGGLDLVDDRGQRARLNAGTTRTLSAAGPAEPRAPAPSHRPEPGKPAKPPEELLAEARALRAEGKLREAAGAYRRLATTHPSSSQARTAWVALGQLQLESLRDPAEALHSYERYLAGGGKGVLDEEARYGRIRALRALGRTRDEGGAIEAFLDRHRESAYAVELRARLHDLRGG